MGGTNFPRIWITELKVDFVAFLPVRVQVTTIYFAGFITIQIEVTELVITASAVN